MPTPAASPCDQYCRCTDPNNAKWLVTNASWVSHKKTLECSLSFWSHMYPNGTASTDLDVCNHYIVPYWLEKATWMCQAMAWLKTGQVVAWWLCCLNASVWALMGWPSKVTFQGLWCELWWGKGLRSESFGVSSCGAGGWDNCNWKNENLQLSAYLMDNGLYGTDMTLANNLKLGRHDKNKWNTQNIIQTTCMR